MKKEPIYGDGLSLDFKVFAFISNLDYNFDEFNLYVSYNFFEFKLSFVDDSY